ncbi:hypothetical protein K2X33_07245 [bacterium]|nr:hypothetical protein [bacterium]
MAVLLLLLALAQAALAHEGDLGDCRFPEMQGSRILGLPRNQFTPPDPVRLRKMEVDATLDQMTQLKEETRTAIREAHAASKITDAQVWKLHFIYQYQTDGLVPAQMDKVISDTLTRFLTEPPTNK